jgi:hypothetical protein
MRANLTTLETTHSGHFHHPRDGTPVSSVPERQPQRVLDVTFALTQKSFVPVKPPWFSAPQATTSIFHAGSAL